MKFSARRRKIFLDFRTARRIGSAAQSGSTHRPIGVGNFFTAVPDTALPPHEEKLLAICNLCPSQTGNRPRRCSKSLLRPFAPGEEGKFDWWVRDGSVYWSFDDDPPGWQRIFEVVGPLKATAQGNATIKGVPHDFFTMSKQY
jgi:hypothetical protein